MVCKNCNNNFTGNFCNVCGQSAKVDRINWKYLINSIFEGVLQINKGFLYTAKSLLLSPAKSLKDFFTGKRKKFFKPFSFLLVCGTIYLISSKLFGNVTFIDDFVTGVKNGAKDYPDESINLTLLDFFANNQTYILLATVPLFSIASFLLFRKSKYNFSEHLIFNLYITGEQILLYAIFSFITDRVGIVIILPIILGFLYNLWVYNTFFNQIGWLKRNLNLLVTYIIYLILIGLSFSLTLKILRIITLNNLS